eukprot:scaffold88154_cov33-Phaeocystis_antarctica.AAC.1
MGAALITPLTLTLTRDLPNLAGRLGQRQHQRVPLRVLHGQGVPEGPHGGRHRRRRPCRGHHHSCRRPRHRIEPLPEGRRRVGATARLKRPACDLSTTPALTTSLRDQDAPIGPLAQSWPPRSLRERYATRFMQR